MACVLWLAGAARSRTFAGTGHRRDGAHRARQLVAGAGHAHRPRPEPDGAGPVMTDLPSFRPSEKKKRKRENSSASTFRMLVVLHFGPVYGRLRVCIRVGPGLCVPGLFLVFIAKPSTKSLPATTAHRRRHDFCFCFVLFFLFGFSFTWGTKNDFLRSFLLPCAAFNSHRLTFEGLFFL